MKNKHVKSFNELNENKNLNISDVSDSKINEWNKEPFIIQSIDECLIKGDLKRLKAIYKGLPENWNNNYLINKLLEYLNS